MLRRSTFPQVKDLNELGFDVFLVWNGKPDSSILTPASKNCVEVIFRERVGFDFAGYRLVNKIVDKDGRYQDAGIFLSNDSFYYFKSSRKVIESILKLKGDIKGLTVIKRSNFHIVAAFLFLTAGARSNPIMREYWRQLKVSWDKKAVITLGEEGLSRAILRAGLEIATYTGVKLSRQKQLRYARLYRAKLLVKGNVGTPNRVTSVLAHSDFSKLAGWGYAFESKNVLHELGPFLTAGWGVPLKRDLINSSEFPWTTSEILEVLRDSDLVSPAEHRNLRQQYSAAPCIHSRTGLEKLFSEWGYSYRA